MNARAGVHHSKLCERLNRRRRSFFRSAYLLAAIVQMPILGGFTSQASAQLHWAGNRSHKWNLDNNWRPHDVPDETKDATIDDIRHGPPVIGRYVNAAARNLIVGDIATGGLTIRNGGILTTSNGTLGNDANSNGTITLTNTNSRWTDSGALFVGRNGTGVLTDSTGAFLSANGVSMGVGAHGHGTVTVDDATFINTGGLTIADGGNATVSMQNGANVTAQFVTSALTPGSQAFLNLDGANTSLIVAGQVIVGSFGTSTVTLSNGALLNGDASGTDLADAVVLGEHAGANATVTLSGRNTGLLSTGDLFVGKAGNATLTLTAGGFVSTATLTIASEAGSTGTINIGAAPGSSPEVPGSLSVASITMGSGTATINFNHTSSALPVSPAIGGNGTVSVIAGTTIFIGNSTYSGSTNISAGATLQLGGVLGDTNSGTITSDITDNGTLIADRSNTLTLPGIISGSGVLQQVGTGTTIITGVNTYSGGTTISAGTLQVGNVNTRSSLGTGAVVDNSVLAVNRYDIYSLANPISGTGQFMQLGIGITALTADNTFTGKTTISDGTLLLGGNGTTGSVAGTITDNSTLGVLRTNSLTFFQLISGSGQLQQLGGGTTILGANNTYTGGTTISAGTLQLGIGLTSGAVIGDINDASSLAVNRLDNLTLAGTISGAGRFTQLGPGTTILTANNTYTGDTTITGGTLKLGDGGTTGSVGGNIIDSSILAVDHSNTVTFSSTITGSGRIQQLGTGTTILAADNNFTGLTTISAGTLQLGNGGTSGSVGTSDIRNASILSVNHTNTFTLPGTISGTGQFNQIGTGTTILTADNIYTGTTTVSAGTLQLGNGSSTGSVAGDITDNGILALNHSGNFTVSNTISGIGQLQQIGTGTSIVTGDNTYTGNTTISAGTLQIGNAGTSGSLGTGAVVNNSVLAVNHSDTFTIGGTISGTGQFDQIGTGTTIFTADSTYSGRTNVANGTLQLGDGGAAGATTGTIIDGSVLAINHSNTFTLPSLISGGGLLRQIGTGTTILTADNTFTGTTIISAGTLQLGNGGTTGSLGASDVIDNSRLSVNRSNTRTFPGTISGTGQFTQLGTGTTILTANNTYTGNTTISAGALQLGNAGATGSVAGNITDNSMLVLNHTNFFALGNVISGTGQLEQIGTNYAVLTANNTYTGLTTISAGGIELGGETASGSIVGDILNNAILLVSRTNALTLPGTISGTGSFSQSGTGTTILTANNTYAGGTSIAAGTLQFGNGGTSGSVAGNITDNANLTLDRRDDVTFSNVISGTGTVTKLGLNTVTITTDQTYTGATNLNEGVLVVDAVMQSSIVTVNTGATLAGNGTIVGDISVTSDVDIGSGGHISPGTTTGAGTLTTDSLILSSISQLDFQLGTANAAGAHDPGNDLLEVNGNLTLDGQLNITGTFGGAGTYRLIDYTGTLTDNGLEPAVLPDIEVPANFIIQTSIHGEVNLIVQATGTGTQFWDGANTTANNAIDGGTGIWNNAPGNTNYTSADGSANTPWNSGFAVFDATPGTVTVDSSSGPVSATGMQFAVDGYTVQGASVTLTGDAPVIEVGDGTLNGANFTATIDSVLDGTGTVTKTGLGTLVLTGTNTYTGGTVISQGILQIGNGGITGSISGAILDDATLVFDHSDDITYADPISGTGSMTKLGAGMLTLTGVNTYTGGTTISQGTLQIGNGGTSGSITGDILDQASLVLNRSDDLTYDGAMSGTGSLTKLGAGTLTLTGENVYTGGTTVSNGTLQIGNGGTTGSVAGNIVDNAAVVFDRSDDITFANVISGNGSVTQLGSGTLTLTGNNDYAGGTTVSNGTLQIGNGGTSGNVAGNILDNASLVFNRSDNVTYANVISGSGSMTQLGSGTLTLTGNNDYAGGTTISAGALQIGIGGASGSIAGDVVDNSLVIFDRSDDITYSNVISGRGSMTQLGAGTLTLTGNNDYTGGTTISAGILQVGNGGTSGSIVGDVLDNASLVFNRSDDAVYDNVISGTGSLTKFGAGTLTLTGENAYTGGTTISSGTLQIGNGGDSGSIAGNILDNAAVIFDRSDDVTYSNVISGSGGVMQLGAGTLTLTGNNAYAGDTTISQGTLQLGNGGGTGSVAGNIVNNGMLIFNRSDDATYTNVISGSGSVSQIGTGTLILAGNNTYAGDTTISHGIIQIGNGGASGSVSGNIIDNAALAFKHSDDITYANVISGTGIMTKLGAGTLTLTGENIYSGGTNIVSGVLQVGNGGITGSIAGDILDQASLVFNRSDDTEFDGIISGSGSVTKLEAGTLILANDSGYTGGTTISQGTLQIGNGGTSGSVAGNILDNASLVFNRSDAITYANVISGSGTVTQIGASTLTFTGNNTYTGDTTISGGTLQIGNGGTTGSVAGNIVDNANLVFNRSDGVTYANVISGSGGVTQLGAGTLILTGNNTYTGDTTVSQGALQIGNGGTSGSVAGNIVDNATLVFNHSDDVTYANAISGNGGMIQLGTGTLILTGNNAYTGGTMVSQGTLQIGNGGTSGSIEGNIVDNAALALNRSDDVEYVDVISGSGSVTQLGAGTLTLIANNTYSGNTIISNGTLEIGDGGASGSVSGNIVDNAALAFNRSDDITYANVISGTGSLTQEGNGVLLLTAANSYTGPTLVQSGALQVDGSINSSTTVDSHATLAGNGTIFGNVQNGGTVAPGSPGTGLADLGKLTIAGNYVGSGGQLVIRGVFGGSRSLTDKLVLSGGNASGDTQISLVNVGGEGARTVGSGIPVVVTHGGATTNTDAFSLPGGFFSVGNYNYSLVRGGNRAPDDWFLQSSRNQPIVPETPTGFRPEASLYSTVPAMSRYLGLVSLGTYYQRQGDQPPLPGQDPAAWGRIIAEHTKHEWSGDVNPSFDGTIYGFQAGLDLYSSVLKNGDHDNFGIFAAYANAEGDVSGLAYNKSSEAGDLNLQATSGGVYFTYVGAEGWYIDTVGMGSWYYATPSSDEGMSATINGAGMSLSLEGGYPIKVMPKKVPTLVLEPQAQIVYQYSTFGDSHDEESDIAFSDGNTFAARIGGRLQVDCPVNHMILKPYAIANLWENFGENDQLFLPGSSPIETRNGSTSLELGLGLATNINANLALYGGGSYIFNLDGNTVNTFFGEIGVRVAW